MHFKDGVELNATSDEIKVFFRIMIHMGILKFPRIRMYWKDDTKIPCIADAMTSKRFFKLRAALHVTDASATLDPPKNKFWKVAPIIDAVRSRCLALEPLTESSIDEQMVPFTGRIPAKQFVRCSICPLQFRRIGA